jgi:hypothetical protein
VVEIGNTYLIISINKKFKAKLFMQSTSPESIDDAIMKQNQLLANHAHYSLNPNTYRFFHFHALQENSTHGHKRVNQFCLEARKIQHKSEVACTKM